MGNKLFQQARDAVYKANQKVQQATTPAQLEDAFQEIEKAKNNLSSAFVHSTNAEKEQLAQLQDQLYNLADQMPETR